ncbi:contractile injection system protein, VgrG/Pvc8 family, partial [Pseudoalteromonas sp. Q18-MNA-CIBAN-0097]
AMDAGKIISSVFEKAGFPAQKLNVQASSTMLDMTVQYNETDYEFVTRLMRKHGFVYSFVEQTSGECTLYICNDSNGIAQEFDEINLSYVPPSGQVRTSESIFAISRQAQLFPQSTHLDDYN